MRCLSAATAKQRLAAIFESAGFSSYETHHQIDLGDTPGRTTPDFYFVDPHDIFEGICIYLFGMSDQSDRTPGATKLDGRIRELLKNKNYNVYEVAASSLFDVRLVETLVYQIGRRLVGRAEAKKLRANSSIYFEDSLPGSKVGDAPQKDSEWAEIFELIDDDYLGIVERIREAHLPVPYDVHSPVMIRGRTSMHEAIIVWKTPAGRVVLVEPAVAGILSEFDDHVVVVGRDAWLNALDELLGKFR